MEFGLVVFLSLFAGWLAGRVFKRQDYSMSGDLLLALLGAFVGLNLSVMLWGVRLTSGLDSTSLISATLVAFVIVSLTHQPLQNRKARASFPRFAYESKTRAQLFVPLYVLIFHLNQSFANRVLDQLRPIVQAEFRENVRAVAFDRLDTDDQAFRDLRIR